VKEVSGTTALLAAVNHNHYSISEYLLRQGADPNLSGTCGQSNTDLEDNCGWTPLHLAVLNVLCNHDFPAVKYVQQLIGAGMRFLQVATSPRRRARECPNIPY
jgi:ankyrin repeat protein